MSIYTVCELSGDYAPDHYQMKRFKRSLIQVLPEHRKKFRGITAALVIDGADVTEWLEGDRGYGGAYKTPCYATAAYWREDSHEYVWNQRQKGRSFRISYRYALLVSDTELLGTVEGVYRETSHSISDVIRRIRRLVGPGLVIDNQVGSRAKIMRKWHKEFNEKIQRHSARWPDDRWDKGAKL